jgi:hypothetical protein
VESKNALGKGELAVAALYLIDLAGSESANAHNNATNARTREMRYINRVRER